MGHGKRRKTLSKAINGAEITLLAGGDPAAQVSPPPPLAAGGGYAGGHQLVQRQTGGKAGAGRWLSLAREGGRVTMLCFILSELQGIHNTLKEILNVLKEMRDRELGLYR